MTQQAETRGEEIERLMREIVQRQTRLQFLVLGEAWGKCGHGLRRDLCGQCSIHLEMK